VRALSYYYLAMPTFKIYKVGRDRVSFEVRRVDDTPVAEINDFLEHLATCGRSGYTLRVYAVGLVHFFEWLAESGIPEGQVSRHTVGQYIGAFSRGPKTEPNVHVQGSSSGADIRQAASTGACRQPRTINHRLSLLASYFAYRIRQDADHGSGPWFQRDNPASTTAASDGGRHGQPGRDAPLRRRTGEFRRRIPRKVPRRLDPGLAEKLVQAAVSWRDKAILTVLLRSGQRIGDWSDLAGRHGVLGMTLRDFDRERGMITVLLKGSRNEHRVPITDDFWPLFDRYFQEERQVTAATMAAWVGLRRGRGEPLSYSAFESSLRYAARKIGLKVHAHLFRHTLAQGVLETTGNLKVAQEILGHSHLSTTADLYMHVDHGAMVEALVAVKAAFDREQRQVHGPDAGAPERYAFPYDEITLEELEKAATQAQSPKGEDQNAGGDTRNRKLD